MEWIRTDLSPCEGVIDHAAVMCDGSLRFETAEAAPAFPVSSIQVLDQDTGETTGELGLREPLDLLDTGGRLVRVGEGSWLVRDGTEWRSLSVDGSATVDRGEGAGWCAGAGGGLVWVRQMDGETRSFTVASTEHPCTTDSGGKELTPSQVQRHAGDLARSATPITGWVTWLDSEGTLRGFRVND